MNSGFVTDDDGAIPRWRLLRYRLSGGGVDSRKRPFVLAAMVSDALGPVHRMAIQDK